MYWIYLGLIPLYRLVLGLTRSKSSPLLVSLSWTIWTKQPTTLFGPVCRQIKSDSQLSQGLGCWQDTQPPGVCVWNITRNNETHNLGFIPTVPDIIGGLTRSKISLSKTRYRNLTRGSSRALDRSTMLFLNAVSRFPSVLRLGDDVIHPSIWWQVFRNLWICSSWKQEIKVYLANVFSSNVSFLCGWFLALVYFLADECWIILFNCVFQRHLGFVNVLLFVSVHALSSSVFVIHGRLNINFPC